MKQSAISLFCISAVVCTTQTAAEANDIGDFGLSSEFWTERTHEASKNSEHSYRSEATPNKLSERNSSYEKSNMPAASVELEKITEVQQGESNKALKPKKLRSKSICALQDAWVVWNNRVNAVMNQRFESVAFEALMRGPSCSCTVAYTVLRNRQITNIRIVEKSRKSGLNMLAEWTVKIMNGNPILDFPKDSVLNSIDRQRTFHSSAAYRFFHGESNSLQGVDTF